YIGTRVDLQTPATARRDSAQAVCTGAHFERAARTNVDGTRDGVGSATNHQGAGASADLQRATVVQGGAREGERIGTDSLFEGADVVEATRPPRFVDPGGGVERVLPRTVRLEIEHAGVLQRRRTI